MSCEPAASSSASNFSLSRPSNSSRRRRSICCNRVVAQRALSVMLGASCVLLECDDPVWPALRRISDLGVAEHSVKHTLDSFEVNVANAPRLRAPNCGSADKAEQLEDLRPGSCGGRDRKSPQRTQPSDWIQTLAVKTLIHPRVLPLPSVNLSTGRQRRRSRLEHYRFRSQSGFNRYS